MVIYINTVPHHLGLIAPAGRDWTESYRPDATYQIAPFEVAVGMQGPCSRVGPPRRTLIASGRFDMLLSHMADATVS
jgi:hypothetical protein